MISNPPMLKDKIENKINSKKGPKKKTRVNPG